MRLLHLDTDDIQNPLRGGQPVRTYEVNRRLVSKGHEVKVFTATYPGCERQVVRQKVAYERLGITIPHWGLSSHLTYLSRLNAAIRREQHDLVVEEFTPPFGFCNTQKATTKPVVSLVQWFFFDDWQKRYKLPFEKIMRKRAVAMPNRHIIVQSNKMGEYFRDLIPAANVYKVPCGINEDAFNADLTLGDYVLFLGRLDIQHKGLDDLLEAWKLLKDQGVSIPLWIAGTGKDEDRLKKRVEALGLNQLVLFKGRIEGQQKYDVVQRCRFMVMPSRQETFGITALEAMANSKPVVAYNIDHLNELLQPSWSQLVALGNIKAFAHAVNTYWLSEKLCLAHGSQAYQAAKYYRWDNIATEQEKIYLNIVGL